MLVTRDLFFLLGPIGAVILVPSLWVVIALHSPRSSVLWVAAAVTGAVGLSWIVYWVVWGLAFDYADTYQPVPQALEVAMSTSLISCAVAVAALVATAVIVLWQRRAHAKVRRGS